MILTNKSSPCTGWGAYRPPADFPTLALRARSVPKLTSGYATVTAKFFSPIWVKNGKKLIIFKNFTLDSKSYK